MSVREQGVQTSSRATTVTASFSLGPDQRRWIAEESGRRTVERGARVSESEVLRGLIDAARVTRVA
jgi:Arc/MetJ-type ribon-helix-helix transcriptional regulator